ncbi:MAG: thiamine diphosphokinase [Candidatus Cryptobacteroides sp.]|nr:thiamine diphosphokinase [Bacteroidales bacterium]MDD7118144.1 thiamine diphosphokinase [Bacteroidales bacterium]MDY2859350.1 thiamine diphosphokinase [Candidatus Cryptobacteroides sp.]MDY5443724.1 thiamine diphosphokinase [Candidatus Cryptobacteroides sp.]MDY6182983.1 thiamine diphosphokinase [Candidatus Cryptobacteroides sp.]
MATAVIVGNGQFPKKEYPLYLLESADYVVCCDGALDTYLRHFSGRNLRRPDVVVGDMDSLSKKTAERFRDIAVKIDEQETNDQSKAFHYILEHFPDVDTIHILGATGKREDHTIGNLSLLMEYAREMRRQDCGRTVSVDIVSDWSTAFAITDSCTLDVGEGRSVSIICPDNSLNIKSEGLVWPTDNVVFDNLWQTTLNRASADRISLTFSHPSIALIILN